MNPQEGTIHLRRLIGTADPFYEAKPYEIFLDEEHLGSLNVNEHRHYRIAAGNHSLHVGYTSLFSSEVIRFQIRPGETLLFECGGQPGVPQPFLRKGSLGELKSGPSQVLSRAARDHIFISYRRSDSADIAGRIYDRLVSKFGRNLIFKDVDSIPLGVNFKEYLDRKVSECKILLAIIGNGWLKAKDSKGKLRLEDPADFLRIEIESALRRKIPIIPLLVDGASMPSEKDLPPSLGELAYRNGLPIRPDPDFHRDMDRVIASLEKQIDL